MKPSQDAGERAAEEKGARPDFTCGCRSAAKCNPCDASFQRWRKVDLEVVDSINT